MNWVEINNKIFQLEKVKEENKEEWNALLDMAAKVAGTLRREKYEEITPKEITKAPKEDTPKKDVPKGNRRKTSKKGKQTERA